MHLASVNIDLEGKKCVSIVFETLQAKLCWIRSPYTDWPTKSKRKWNKIVCIVVVLDF